MICRNLINKLPKYSYGRFLFENKKTNSIQRRKALKKFLDKIYNNQFFLFSKSNGLIKRYPKYGQNIKLII